MGKAFQAKESASVKALKWELALNFLGLEGVWEGWSRGSPDYLAEGRVVLISAYASSRLGRGDPFRSSGW